MTRGIPRSLRRASALAILVAALAILWTLAIQPLVDLAEGRRDEIDALSFELVHLRNIVGRTPELERRAASSQTALDAEGGLWTGLRPAEIAAAMQDRLRQVIASSAGRLRRTAVVSEAADHGFLRVTLHFSVEGTLETVQAALGSVEAAKPAMFVDNLSIHVVDAGGPDRPPALTMELDVSGYARMPNA